MNKIKSEFEKIKPSINDKAKMYSYIMNNNKKGKKRGFGYRLLTTFAIFLIVLILSGTAVYAASEIFGFDFDFLKFSNYSKEELIDKGVQGKNINYEKTFDNGLRIKINNIIYDGAQLELFVDIENFYNVCERDERNFCHFHYDIQKDGRSIAASAGGIILSVTNPDDLGHIEIIAHLREEIKDGDTLSFVINENYGKTLYTIDFEMTNTITKTRTIEVNDASYYFEGREYKINKITATPYSIVVNMDKIMEVNNSNFNDLVYDKYQYMHYVFVGTNDGKEYLVSSYPLIIQNITDDSMDMVYLDYRSYIVDRTDYIIDVDDISYVRIYNYNIDAISGSVEFIGNNYYHEVDSFNEINNNGKYVYIEVNDYHNIIDSLSYINRVNVYVKNSDKNIIELYNNNELISHQELQDNTRYAIQYQINDFIVDSILK